LGGALARVRDGLPTVVPRLGRAVAISADIDIDRERDILLPALPRGTLHEGEGDHAPHQLLDLAGIGCSRRISGGGGLLALRGLRRRRAA
jgi:hypothetical protein